MPKLDGTGPMGQGPRTGRGCGPCGDGMMRGCGGFRKFFGGCCGYCNGCCGKGRFADPISKEDKLANLEEEEKMLGEELAAIKKEKEALK